MTTAVDTNALLGLLYDDDYGDESEQALRQAYRNGRLVVTPVVYAELAADGHFETAAPLDEFLADFSISVETPSRNALFRAGQAFRRYADTRPDGFQCPECGEKRSVSCPNCQASLSHRQHVAADFLIGGHAAVDTEELITFDAGFYGTYFESLSVRP